jgi:hypothetical protein
MAGITKYFSLSGSHMGLRRGSSLGYTQPRNDFEPGRLPGGNRVSGAGSVAAVPSGAIRALREQLGCQRSFQSPDNATTIQHKHTQHISRFRDLHQRS